MAVYVLSDVHGLMDRFLTMLEQIHLQDHDTLYILGDVIDRGQDGIALLQMIRKQTNMILLMGNHEHMMIEYYAAQKQLSQKKDIITAIERIGRWDLNHNDATKAAFERLCDQEQADLLAYLQNLPLAYPDVIVNNHHYYLVHANWHSAFMHEPITLADCHKQGVDPFHLVWDRIDASHRLPSNRTLIFGHTITLFFQNVHPYAIWSNHQPLHKANLIGIDCGCAANHKDSRLACIRLDDLEVFYV